MKYLELNEYSQKFIECITLNKYSKMQVSFVAHCTSNLFLLMLITLEIYL